MAGNRINHPLDSRAAALSFVNQSHGLSKNGFGANLLGLSTRLPLWLIVAPVSLSPALFSTGIDSTEIIEILKNIILPVNVFIRVLLKFPQTGITAE